MTDRQTADRAANNGVDLNRQAIDDGYDREMVPAETAARAKREGANYKQTPLREGTLDTSSGYTVDREGLTNNYAIEPEMYVNEPGDLRQKQEAEAQQRAAELRQVRQNDEEGMLSMDGDERGRGPGAI